ncbi:hypothetical protein JR316_0012366 [Psilocybe cubensis]|uniref:F-box domain-containing protein n=2 Tax=Psilocybe cubensis TaxID=181762 RepID=A0A8H7XRC9_PSICU|nr:hypothetical protein JR316_0012366 [Psilocybe cubensis]KAH9475255.1 hypothetical protein JR316_0012366 [Psilocybe cubensis]
MASCANCGSITEYSLEQVLCASVDRQQLLKRYDLEERNLLQHNDTAHMDTHIDSLQFLIDELRKRRALACRSRNRYAPVARLPVELLSEIFRFTLSTDIHKDHKCFQPTTVPLLLGKVCSEWRNIAWGLAELWSSFHCRVSKTRYSAQATLLREWIDRSGGRPLDIRITLEDEDSWNVSGITSTHIIDVLLLHCHNWRSLDLILPETWYNKLQNVREKLENLASVTIRPPGYIFILKSLNAFANAPSLRRISSSHYYMHDLLFPWEQLTEATLGTASTDEAIELIRRCPNLVSCRFDDLNSIEGEFPLDGVLHTGLKQLRIYLNIFATLAPFIGPLTLSNLSLLDLSVPPAHSNPLNTVEQLLDRSECPLRTIKITGISIQDEDIISFLVYNDAVKNVNNMMSKDQDPAVLCSTPAT